MNILIYVISILLVLSAMTYSRLQTYRTTATMEASFLYYMKTTEGLKLNKVYLEQYNRLKVPKPSQTKTPETPEAKPTSPTEAKGTARLGLELILNQKKRLASPTAAQQSKELFKQLMITLYSKQKFFQDIAAKRPQFLDEIIEQLQILADAAQNKQTPNKKIEISRLEIPDQDLRYALFLMFNGLKNADLTTETTAKAALFQTNLQLNNPEEILDTDDESEAFNNIQENFPPSGYTSLYDFTTSSNGYHLRVFLASPVLLMAIYKNVDTVNQIREMRNELYKEVHNDPNNAALASAKFKAAFENLGDAPSYSAILNFAVTNTNPKKYEKL